MILIAQLIPWNKSTFTEVFLFQCEEFKTQLEATVKDRENVQTQLDGLRKDQDADKQLMESLKVSIENYQNHFILFVIFVPCFSKTNFF